MKNRNKSRAPNHTKFGVRKHSPAPRTIMMTRATFDENGQFIGTEQVEAQVQFDRRNGCYQIMVDEDSCDSAESGQQDEIVQLLHATTQQAQEAKRLSISTILDKEGN